MIPSNLLPSLASIKLEMLVQVTAYELYETAMYNLFMVIYTIQGITI